MNVSSEKTRSPWMTMLSESAPRLPRNLKADVVIVGAGIAGMTTAYLLARAGRKVIVLDAGPPGGGMTARTTGHLATALDDRWFNLIARRGIEKARIASASHAAAIDFIERTVSAEGIACDFARVDGFLVLGIADNKKTLNRELKACGQVGLDRVAWSDRSPFPGLNAAPCLCFPSQGRFHAIKYLNGLIRCFRRDGGRIFNARVTAVRGGKKAVIEAGGRRVEAVAAVVATNSPINSPSIHSKQVPYRTYVVAGYAPKDAAPDALAWDTDKPYHYTRLQPAEDGKRDLVIIGGEDHKTGEANDMEVRFQRLETWGRVRFPALAEYSFRWSGQVMETRDNLGFFGRNLGDADNIYIVTGDSGMGLTHGTIAGLTISDQIFDRSSAWASLYDPMRAKPRAVGPNNSTTSEKLVPPGSGAVVTRGRLKVAVYCGLDGKRIERSAKCTHAGCTVAWNQLEQCWDCPCHGSQFAADGTVLNGPAMEDLARLRGY
jgi:glycine/D-amino acid oxidase-like deaminating enzyme/nitrite reductase/ring-hydroxylating ferredoxin subunit